MGYQVNYFKMHSEKYGSYQRRQRIILTIAAPGLTPIAEPKATHSTLEACKVNHKSKVSKSPHKCTHAPFKRFNAGDGIGDLPHIDRGTVHECIRFPDHRLPSWNKLSTRDNQSDPPPGECLLPKEKSQRICKCHLMPTVLTSNSKNSVGWSAGLHYEQLRTFTIQEARRGQGWPDEEVVVGTPQQQYAIVGNGVDRSVSFALGLSLFQSVKNDTTVGIGRSGFSGLQDCQLPIRVARPRDRPQEQARSESHLETRLRTAPRELDDDNVRHRAAAYPTRITRRIAASPATTKSSSIAPKEKSVARPTPHRAAMGSAASSMQKRKETHPLAGPSSKIRRPPPLMATSRAATVTPPRRPATPNITESAPATRKSRKRCGNKELSALGIPHPSLRQTRSQLDGDTRELRIRHTTRATYLLPEEEEEGDEDGEGTASSTPPPRKKRRVSGREGGALECFGVR